MNEIEITCTCQSIALADLGLVLVKGQVAHVDASSRDLETATRAGAVRVRDVRRADVVRPAVQPEQGRTLPYVHMASAVQPLADPITQVSPEAIPPAKARRRKGG